MAPWLAPKYGVEEWPSSFPLTSSPCASPTAVRCDVALASPHLRASDSCSSLVAAPQLGGHGTTEGLWGNLWPRRGRQLSASTALETLTAEQCTASQPAQQHVQEQHHQHHHQQQQQQQQLYLTQASYYHAQGAALQAVVAAAAASGTAGLQLVSAGLPAHGTLQLPLLFQLQPAPCAPSPSPSPSGHIGSPAAVWPAVAGVAVSSAMPASVLQPEAAAVPEFGLGALWSAAWAAAGALAEQQLQRRQLTVAGAAAAAHASRTSAFGKQCNGDGDVAHRPATPSARSQMPAALAMQKLQVFGAEAGRLAAAGLLFALALLLAVVIFVQRSVAATIAYVGAVRSAWLAVGTDMVNTFAAAAHGAANAQDAAALHVMLQQARGSDSIVEAGRCSSSSCSSRTSGRTSNIKQNNHNNVNNHCRGSFLHGSGSSRASSTCGECAASCSGSSIADCGASAAGLRLQEHRAAGAGLRWRQVQVPTALPSARVAAWAAAADVSLLQPPVVAGGRLEAVWGQALLPSLRLRVSAGCLALALGLWAGAAAWTARAVVCAAPRAMATTCAIAEAALVELLCAVLRAALRATAAGAAVAHGVAAGAAGAVAVHGAAAGRAAAGAALALVALAAADGDERRGMLIGGVLRAAGAAGAAVAAAVRPLVVVVERLAGAVAASMLRGASPVTQTAVWGLAGLLRRNLEECGALAWQLALALAAAQGSGDGAGLSLRAP
jgi:hypothetical protein